MYFLEKINGNTSLFMSLLNHYKRILDMKVKKKKKYSCTTLVMISYFSIVTKDNNFHSSNRKFLTEYVPFFSVTTQYENIINY